MFGKTSIKTTPVVSGKTVRSMAAGLYLCIAAIGLTATSAHATLIVQDLVSGDSKITLDTNTNLEWLDVTATLGLSAAAALTTSFVTVEGFVLATAAQLSTLWAGVGVTLLPSNNTPSAANLAGAQELISKMGCTGNCANPSSLVQNGFIAGAIPNRANIGLSGGTTAFAFTTFGGSSGSSMRGNYLVRAVPEPATLAGLGLGLAGLGVMRRRRAA